VVFGNELAKKEGIGGEMDFFLRDNEMRYSVLLAVSEGKASEILAADTNYEHVPAKELAELIRNQATNSGSVECNLLDFVRDATAEGSTCLVPVVRIKEEPLAAGGEESGEKASKESKGQEGGEKKFEVNGSAVFKGDVMVGQLDERETRGALWVRDKVDRGIIEASFDGVDTEIEVFECKTFTSVKINDKGEVSVDIRCEIYANIAGLSGYEGLLNKELTEKIRNSAAAAVKEEILSAWEKSKEMECDVFCLGNKVYKKTPDLWRKYQQSWQKMYNETTFNFNIDINIEDVGDLTGEVQWKGGDDKK
jgi:spore germination protein KC